MPKPRDTAASSETPKGSSQAGQHADAARPLRSRVREFLKDTLESGNENELSLFAPAMAYALVVSLAPLTFSLNSLTASFIESDALIPGSPIGNTEFTAEKIAGDAYAWAGPMAIVIGFLLVLWGASSLFTHFVRAIHRIWGDAARSGVGAFMKSRGLAMLLLFIMALALFASAVFGTAASGLAGIVRSSPGS